MIENIKFLGIPVFKNKKTKYYEKKYLFGLCIRKSKKEKYWIEDFCENNPTLKNQYIYFLGTPLGEASIFARTLPFWYKNNAKIICTKRQHIEIFKLFAPDTKIHYQGKGSLIMPIRVNENYFDPILGTFELVSINNQEKHFFKQWEKYLNADFSKQEFSKARISEKDRESAFKKLEQKKVNLEKYVFIMKNANSIKELNRLFWLKLEVKLKKMGFDIVYNSKNFSITEAYAIAEKAKALISLRNGFNDILSEIKVPQFLIYSKGRLHDDLQQMYTMKYFPWAVQDYITEYNTVNQKTKDIISDILKKIVKENKK